MSALLITASEQGESVAALPPGPVRTCVGCREKSARSELLRVTAQASDGFLVLVPDPSATAPGRGAWIHSTEKCVVRARQRRVWQRALRAHGECNDSAVWASVTVATSVGCASS